MRENTCVVFNASIYIHIKYIYIYICCVVRHTVVQYTIYKSPAAKLYLHFILVEEIRDPRLHVYMVALRAYSAYTLHPKNVSHTLHYQFERTPSERLTHFCLHNRKLSGRGGEGDCGEGEV